MPSREEIAEQVAKELQIIDPTKHERPSERSSDSELIVWEAFKKTWNAYISARVELAEREQAESKLAELGYVWEEGKGYVFDGKD